MYDTPVPLDSEPWMWGYRQAKNSSEIPTKLQYHWQKYEFARNAFRLPVGRMADFPCARHILKGCFEFEVVSTVVAYGTPWKRAIKLAIAAFATGKVARCLKQRLLLACSFLVRLPPIWEDIIGSKWFVRFVSFTKVTNLGVSGIHLCQYKYPYCTILKAVGKKHGAILCEGLKRRWGHYFQFWALVIEHISCCHCTEYGKPMQWILRFAVVRASGATIIVSTYGLRRKREHTDHSPSALLILCVIGLEQFDSAGNYLKVFPRLSEAAQRMKPAAPSSWQKSEREIGSAAFRAFATNFVAFIDNQTLWNRFKKLL